MLLASTAFLFIPVISFSAQSLFVTATDSNVVDVINPLTNQLITTIPVG